MPYHMVNNTTRELTNLDRKRIVEFYKRGHTPAEIASIMG